MSLSTPSRPHSGCPRWPRTRVPCPDKVHSPVGRQDVSRAGRLLSSDSMRFLIAAGTCGQASQRGLHDTALAAGGPGLVRSRGEGTGGGARILLYYRGLDEGPNPLQLTCKMQTVLVGGVRGGADTWRPSKGSWDCAEVGTGQGAAERPRPLPQPQVGSLQKPTDRTPLAGEHIQARASLHKGQSPETATLGRSPPGPGLREDGNTLQTSGPASRKR